jgi:hypothetical protein
MAAKKKKKGPHKGHKDHLCAMIAGGLGYKDVKPLVQNPKYICGKCGRAARKKGNLCSARNL